MPTISIVFDLPESNDGYRFTVEALGHAAAASGDGMDIEVVRTVELAAGRPIGDGVVLGPGSPYDAPAAVEALATRARREGIPLVGT